MLLLKNPMDPIGINIYLKIFDNFGKCSRIFCYASHIGLRNLLGVNIKA